MLNLATSKTWYLLHYKLIHQSDLAQIKPKSYETKVQATSSKSITILWAIIEADSLGCFSKLESACKAIYHHCWQKAYATVLTHGRLPLAQQWILLILNNISIRKITHLPQGCLRFLCTYRWPQKKNVIWKVYDLLKDKFLRGMEDRDKRFATYHAGRLTLHYEHLSHQLMLQWSWTRELT